MPSPAPVFCYFLPPWCFRLLSSSSSLIMPLFPWLTTNIRIIHSFSWTVYYLSCQAPLQIHPFHLDTFPITQLHLSWIPGPHSDDFLSLLTQISPFFCFYFCFWQNFSVLPKKHREHKSWPSFLTFICISIFLLLQILHYFLSQTLTFLLCSLLQTPSYALVNHLLTPFASTHSLSFFSST